MGLKVEDLDNTQYFSQLLAISYSDLIEFIFKYLKKITPVITLFWFLNTLFLGIAIITRIEIASEFSFLSILLHSMLGFILLPILCIPFHEALHIIPYYISGARDIRMGMDLRQYIFYVTAHRYVADSRQFIIVALVPFVLISLVVIALVIILPGLWKWSLSVFLFAHGTMCAGDAALLNFYYVNRDKKIYTWDDADEKMAYFYEKI
ncbi:MAG TPA: DUF3267 domain-containing protein [Bacteroidales bacterium]|nr:DUF3267 domain-containing protein [Bacteroidales bacterium]